MQRDRVEAVEDTTRGVSTADALVEQAAAPTLERIRRDRDRAPVKVRPLLEYLQTHLFDPGLDARQLKRACGVRDNTLATRFHAAVSLPPFAYIESCRMEIACRLLKMTDLQVWKIGHALGYSTVQVFSRAFDRWAGVRPSRYRQLNGTADPALPPQLESGTIIRAIEGRLDRAEADDLIRKLYRLYPGSFEAAQLQPPGEHRC